ncbi:hypothetical protein ACS0TY_006113 [Phlomoides rotata]
MSSKQYISELVYAKEVNAGILMDPTGTASGHGGNKEKTTRSRRSWSSVEEDALIECLIGIMHDGWKADNDFRAGFQRELEKALRKKLPGTDIVANPHINSKIHVWKKKYSNLSDLLSKSGIGWNSTTSMLRWKMRACGMLVERLIRMLRGFGTRLDRTMASGWRYLGRTVQRVRTLSTQPIFSMKCYARVGRSKKGRMRTSSCPFRMSIYVSRKTIVCASLQSPCSNLGLKGKNENR